MKMNPGSYSMKKVYEKFMNGEYAGEYEKKLIADFEKVLPELPPWKR